MPAGRPHNSKTPPSHSKAAVKVRAYRFLMGDKGTKSHCARITGLARKTVIGWWDKVAWTEESNAGFQEIQDCMSDHIGYRNITPERLTEWTDMPLDMIRYELETLDYIFRYSELC